VLNRLVEEFRISFMVLALQYMDKLLDQLEGKLEDNIEIKIVAARVPQYSLYNAHDQVKSHS
jgi:hypothetical protein